MSTERLRCKARKGAILRVAIGLDSEQAGLLPMGAEVAVLETRMLGAKERVLVEADDGTKGWGSRSVFDRCPEPRVATPRSATLNTGRTIPLLGFGTWKLPGDAKTKAVVRDAIRAGYRARPRFVRELS